MSAPAELDFSRREWRVIQACTTPSQVQRWLNGMPYNSSATLRSFRGVVKTQTAHCLEAALAAAVILEQHGYPVRFLDLASQDDLDHVLFLYQRRGRWGTIARSRDPGLHGRNPVFKTVRALVESYFDTYVDMTGRIVGYGVRTMEGLSGYDWRLSPRNVWKVEREFIASPITRFHAADRRYDYWHARYQAYKRRFPDRKPLYYTNKRTWAPGYPKG